jgi:hypothetical protein
MLILTFTGCGVLGESTSIVDTIRVGWGGESVVDCGASAAAVVGRTDSVVKTPTALHVPTLLSERALTFQ